MNPVEDVAVPTAKDLELPGGCVLNTILTANRVLVPRMRRGEAPCALILAYVMNNAASKRRAIVIIEGKRSSSDRVARGICALFPDKHVVIETIGVKGLPARQLSTARLVYVPNVDAKPDIWRAFETWTPGGGFVMEDVKGKPGEETIRTIQIGHTPVIASCEAASSLPSWLREGALIVPARMIDASWKSVADSLMERMTPDTGGDVNAITTKFKSLIETESRTADFLVPFGTELKDFFIDKLVTMGMEDEDFVAIMEAVSAVTADAHYLLSSGGQITVVVHPRDFSIASKLANLSTERGWSLTTDDVMILDAIRLLSKPTRVDEVETKEGDRTVIKLAPGNPDTSRWVRTVEIKEKLGIGASPSSDEDEDDDTAPIQERLIPKRTFYSRLDRMVEVGLLQVRNRGRGTMHEYKINRAVDIEEKGENAMLARMQAQYDQFITDRDGIAEKGYIIKHEPVKQKRNMHAGGETCEATSHAAGGHA